MTESIECGRCGRQLKDVKSRERGYGPVCFKKVQEANERAEDDNRPVQESFEV